MSEETEYIEPTQECVGKLVSVYDEAEKVWKPRTLIEVLPEGRPYRFICENMKTQDRAAAWKTARVPVQLSYAQRQANCGLRVGDRVLFTREWNDNEREGTVSFLKHGRSMVPELGTVGTIIEISPAATVVRFKNITWSLPYFVLAKIEVRLPTFEDIGKSVHLVDSPDEEYKLELVYLMNSDNIWRAIICSNGKRLVYELSDLRITKGVAKLSTLSQ